MNQERIRNSHGRMPKLLALVTLLCVASSSAWAGSDTAAPQSAGFWDGVLETLNLRTKVGPMPDFVQATHPDPAKLHFIPTGTPHPVRPNPVKNIYEVEAAKSALDAAHDAQLERAASPAIPPAPPPPMNLRPAKLKATANQN